MTNNDDDLITLIRHIETVEDFLFLDTILKTYNDSFQQHLDDRMAGG